VRIVDPDFKTSTAVELGACNLAMLFCTPVYFIILALASGALKMGLTVILLAACVVVYLVLLKILKLCGKKTYSM
jgi:ESS family glutamate:Na+ symporter